MTGRLIGGALVCVAALGDTSGREMSAIQEPTFRAAVEVVTIDAYAHDGHGPLRGLRMSDFVVLDDGVEQAIRSVSQVSGVHVIAGLDVSRSVAGVAAARLREGAESLLERLTVNDRVSIFTFGDRIRVHAVAIPPEKWTVQLSEIGSAGATAVHDAIVLGSALARADARPALFVLFTDGVDTASWTLESQALEIVRRTDAAIYVIGAGLPAGMKGSSMRQGGRGPMWLAPQPPETLRLLQSLAEISGGRLVRVERGQALQQVFKDVVSQYRERYLLSYTPTGVQRSGWHRLVVRLRGRRGEVVARAGYMAP